MRIGPNFSRELAAAGLSGLPFSWSDSGELSFYGEVTPAQRQAVLDVYASHNPLKAVVPAVVEMRQARLALLGAGRLDAVEAAIAGMTGTAGKAAQIDWEFARTLRRDHPLTVGLSAALGLNSAALDALFTQAAAIE